MRLLRASDFTFHEFEGDVPAYAILSHTWEDNEVLYKDMLKGRYRSKKGFKKIQYCATQAISDGFQFIWVDTCNIDKKSSAELSEAINSMYKWYEAAQVCYVYLADVDYSDLEVTKFPHCAFRSSRWFTRGWTLQELIAPLQVLFYTSRWEELGTKDALAADIAHITRIDLPVLTGDKYVHNCSIANRMSWASQRNTTRDEDIAYCLLGIFDVNIPLLYGEGSKAFIRLQEEIIKKSNDDSIFAWTSDDKVIEWTDEVNPPTWKPSVHSPGLLGVSLLAEDIRHFAWARYRDTPPGAEVGWQAQHSYTPTNIGLQITLQMAPWDALGDQYIARLRCRDLQSTLCIILRCVDAPSRQFTRVATDSIVLVSVPSFLYSTALPDTKMLPEHWQELSIFVTAPRVCCPPIDYGLLSLRHSSKVEGDCVAKSGLVNIEMKSDLGAVGGLASNLMRNGQMARQTFSLSSSCIVHVLIWKTNASCLLFSMQQLQSDDRDQIHRWSVIYPMSSSFVRHELAVMDLKGTLEAVECKIRTHNESKDHHQHLVVELELEKHIRIDASLRPPGHARSQLR